MNSSAPPGVVLSLRERKYPKRSLRDRKLEGGLCNAGAGHRDFDFPRSSLGEEHRNHKTCLCPLAMCFAIAQCSDLLMLCCDKCNNRRESSKSQIMFVHPHLSFVSISRTICDRPAVGRRSKDRRRMISEGPANRQLRSRRTMHGLRHRRNTREIAPHSES